MSALYPSFKQALLDTGLNLATFTVKVALLDSADEVYNAADVFLSDVTAAGIVGTAQTLASKTFVGGVFDAADATFPGVTGDSVEAAVLYVDTGTATTSRLIAYLDGISVTPNGGSIILTFDNGASKIFAL